MADSFEKQLAQLNDTLDALAVQIPEKALPKAAKIGSRTVLGAIRAKAPSRTGALRTALKINREKVKKYWMAVNDVYVDPKKNAVFQKPIKNPILSKSKHAYYPASQEYGFFKRRPGGGLQYVSPASASPSKVPGKYFMRSGAINSEETAKHAMLESISEAIDEIWR